MSSLPENPTRPAVSPNPDASISGDGHPGLDFLRNDERQVEFQRAVRHSGKVRFLKIALPVTGGLVIIGIVAALLLRSFLFPQIDLGSIKVTDGQLVMENPRLKGVDGKKRPYNLTANKAVQNVENPARVALEEVLAEFPVEGDVFAKVTAGVAVYDAEAKTLDLDNQVTVSTSDGTQVVLDSADIDIERGMMRTDYPVVAKSAKADISSGRMYVEDSGQRIVFEEKVKITLRPAEIRKGNAEQ